MQRHSVGLAFKAALCTPTPASRHKGSASVFCLSTPTPAQQSCPNILPFIILPSWSSTIFITKHNMSAEATSTGNGITVGVILFPGFEPLDVVGPVSVFGSVPGIKMVYIAEAAGPVTSVTANMTFVASESFSSMPPQTGKLDWLLVPGGIGSREEVKNTAMLDYIKGWCEPAAGLQLVMSVCTGSAILAAAGVLDGRRATSNKVAWDWVTSVGSNVSWVRKARWVHDGVFLTSSGVTAGTDAAVYAVRTLLTAQEAAAATKRLEHTPIIDAESDPYTDADYVPEV